MKTVMPWIIRLALLAAVLVGGWLAMGHFLRPQVLVLPAARGTALNAITGSVETDAEFSDPQNKSMIKGWNILHMEHACLLYKLRSALSH